MEDKIKAKKSGGETRKYTRGEYLVQGQARSNSGSSPPSPPTHTRALTADGRKYGTAFTELETRETRMIGGTKVRSGAQVRRSTGRKHRCVETGRQVEQRTGNDK